MKSITFVSEGNSKDINFKNTFKNIIIARATIKAIIWFLVIEDANIPIEHKADIKNTLPIYPPITGPKSSLPNNNKVIGYIIVGKRAKSMNITADKNFPIIISKVETDCVLISS